MNSFENAYLCARWTATTVLTEGLNAAGYITGLH